jgi:hypothetical protein
MTTVLRAKFDGKVLVPEGPVNLPIGEVLEVRVAESDAQDNSGAAASSLAHLAAVAEALPRKTGPVSDRAAQHDHYLYGLPKRT